MRNRTLLTFCSLLILGFSPAAGAESIDRISTSSGGIEGDGASDAVAINGDGSIVAFRSDATNLVSTDSNALTDVFVKKLSTGKVELISQSTKGVAGNAFSGGGQSDERPIRISSDGRYVIFQSAATTLAPGGSDLNDVSDIFVRDRTAATTTLVSLEGASTQGSLQSDSPSISDDGQSLTFDSFSGLFYQVDPVDTSGLSDVFLRTLADSTTIRASSEQFGGTSNGNARLSSISADGLFVAYQSTGSNHISVDQNFASDIFLYDVARQSISRVSTTNAGGESNGASRLADISKDGQFVAFESDAENLTADDGNGFTDIFVKNVSTGEIELVSKSSSGTTGNGGSYAPSISSDGRYVAFKSIAINLIDSDLNDSIDIFVRDRLAGTTKRVSFRRDGSESVGAIGYFAISGDGQYVVFSSTDNLIVPGDTNGVADLFRVRITDTLDSDTTIASPPAVTVKKKSVKLTLQLFTKVDAPQVTGGPVSSQSTKKNFVEYTVNVRQTGKGGDRFRIISRRNQVTLKNLRPGNYVASYRATAMQRTTTKTNGQKIVKETPLFKTNISPRAKFLVP